MSISFRIQIMKELFLVLNEILLSSAIHRTKYNEFQKTSEQNFANQNLVTN